MGEIRVGDILNSEGSLLSFNVIENGELYLEVTSRKYNGDFSFRPKLRDFLSYIESKLTLSELIEISTVHMFSFNEGEDIRKIPLTDIIQSLPFIESYFKEIPEGCK